MRTFMQLAFRNVFRNRRRTLMTLLVVAGGISALLLAGGFFSYMFWGFRESTIHNGLGHLQIYHADYFDKEEAHVLDNGLENYEAIEASAAALPHVKGMAPRIEFFGMVSNGMKSGTYMATALLPAAEKKMGFTPRILDGRALNQDAAANEVLIGAGLAKSMNVKPGGGLTLLAVTADGALNGIDVEVAGIYTTRVKALDDRVIQLTLPAAQRLLQTSRVTKLVVGLDDTDNTPAVRAALAARRRDVAIRDWRQLSPEYGQIILLFGGIFVFMSVIVFFMVVMSTANTMMMSVFERTREIGTMLAMGTPRGWVLALLVAEGAATGVLGAIAGVLAGSGLAVLLNHAGLQMPAPPGQTDGFPFHVHHVPALMAGASALAVLTLAAASIPPALHASRLKIVQALGAL
ncbi:MAG: ABC transporter permease [Acidobacteriota bacterium]